MSEKIIRITTCLLLSAWWFGTKNAFLYGIWAFIASQFFTSFFYFCVMLFCSLRYNLVVRYMKPEHVTRLSIVLPNSSMPDKFMWGAKQIFIKLIATALVFIMYMVFVVNTNIGQMLVLKGLE